VCITRHLDGVLVLLGLCFACTGCHGELGEPEGPTQFVEEAGEIGEAGEGSANCDARWPRRLVLLSDFQHVTTLRTLFGSELFASEDAPRRELKPFAQKGVVVKTSHVHTRMGWAEEALAKLRANPVQQTGCSSVDEDCAERYLRKLVPRAFRRSVSDVEIGELMDVYRVGAETDGLNGLACAVEAALSAPSFLYRRELGLTGGGAEVALDDYELASVISYALIDGPPDDTLWQAAEAGTLSEPDELATQVERLLTLPSVQENLTSTLLAAWGLGNLFGTVKDPTLFPEFTPQLQGSMYRETELLVSDVLWTRKAPVRELLTTRSSFVNASLATLYGLALPGATATDFQPVSLPQERAGLLTQASVLSMLARTDTTSVVARGLFTRGLLCMPKLPGPPEELADDITALLMADMTERERAEVRANTPTCAGCHAGIDAFGLLLESYDPLGRHRTTLAGAAIDTRVEIAGGAPYGGRFDDVNAFMGQVAQGNELSSCITTRLLSYASQDDALTPIDCRVQQALATGDAAALSMGELVQRVLTSSALRTRMADPPEESP
jgi:hypothetical protein